MSNNAQKHESLPNAIHWGFDLFHKHPLNPILLPQEVSWESHAVFNPAAWTDKKKVYLLYRAEGPLHSPHSSLTSRVGLAVSSDGIHFEREFTPILEPTEPYELPGGCEDPRLVRVDGTFYMTYTAYDGKTARIAMAVSHDLYSWRKQGLLFPELGWTKSAAMLDQPINGFYWMYFGDTHIWAAYSKDLDHWTIVDEPVLSPRQHSFDSRLVEPGPPPLITARGILLIYNSADDNLRYSMGQSLFDLNNPTQMIRRTSHPILEPTEVMEKEGQVPNVVFTEGLVEFNGRWFLYYGMADSCIGVAISDWL